MRETRHPLKDRTEIERQIAAHLARHQLEHVAGMSDAWPQRIALGCPTKAEIAAYATEIGQIADELAAWSAEAPLRLEYAPRKSGGAMHSLPTRAVVETIEDAAVICGRASERALERDRARHAQLHGLAACDSACAVKVLKATRAWDEVDFDLLVDAARWFVGNDASGLTPRQVPLPGFSAKWLDATGRRALVEALCGKKLNLAQRSRSIELAYLDPAHLDAGGRRYDSWVEGDAFTLPYQPTRCFIVENKDTFRAFPPTAGDICVFGSGWAGTAIVPEVPWLSDVERVFYWGDIDADGFEILDAYRAAGVNAASVLMDMRTYRAFEPFGTDASTSKTPLDCREEKPLAHLTDDERTLYRLLVSPGCPTHRRIEQERIPFWALNDCGVLRA